MYRMNVTPKGQLVIPKALRERYGILPNSSVVVTEIAGHIAILPAIDPLSSYSSALSPQTAGELHYQTSREALTLLKKGTSLERVASLVGVAELSPEDGIIYQRAKKLRNFMTQNLFVIESQTGIPGQYVTLKTTINDVNQILAGKFDHIPEEKFLHIGSVEEIRQ